MTTLTIRVTSVCSGGNHYTVQTGGEFTRTFVIDAASIQDMTEEEAETFIRGCIFLSRRGKTPTQFRNAMQTGLTVTV